MFLENGLKGLVISLVTGIIGIVITYLSLPARRLPPLRWGMNGGA